jgi:hypothetical protein
MRKHSVAFGRGGICRIRNNLLFMLSLVVTLSVPIQNLSAGEATNEVPILNVVEQIRANETNALSVVIEGTYEWQDYNSTGQLTYVHADSFDRFSRHGSLIKVECHGASHPLDGNTGNFVTVPHDEVIFYSPESTIFVYSGFRLARREAVEEPFFFPLYFGYGLRYDYKKGEIVALSPALEAYVKGGYLKWRKDSDDPGLIVLEETDPTGRFKWWIDPKHGCLIVKMESYLKLHGLSKPEILLEKVEAVPKQFDGHWFIGSAHRVQYYTDDWTAAVEGFVSRAERTITITNFHSGATFRPGELEFSTNKFPALEFIYDRKKNEVLDLKTGKRSAWVPSQEGTKPDSGLNNDNSRQLPH